MITKPTLKQIVIQLIAENRQTALPAALVGFFEVVIFMHQAILL